jgi:hypothetical protein
MKFNSANETGDILKTDVILPHLYAIRSASLQIYLSEIPRDHFFNLQQALNF